MRTELIATANRETWAIDLTWLSVAVTSPVQAAKPAKLPKVNGGVAFIPIHGVISQRSSIWSEIFGGTSTQGLQAAYTRAVNEPAIKAIVFDVDSPGGTVTGVKEASDAIFTGRSMKPTYALANGQAASASYWLASQSEKFYASPHSDVGSIGVYRAHFDESELMAKVGVKASFISVPEFKVEGNPFQPLSNEAVAHHMEQVLTAYEDFTKDVGRGRGVPQSKVKSSFGKGRSFTASIAADMGLVDGVKTLSQVSRELAGEPVMMSSAANAELTELLCQAWQSAEIEDRAEDDAWLHELRRRRLALAEKS